MGNGIPPFAALLNRLAALRNSARYNPDLFALGDAEAREGMELLDAVICSMSVWRPSRAYGPFPLPIEFAQADQ